MTTMIRSHTGAMVPARVGMVYSHEYAGQELFTIKAIEGEQILADVSYADEWRHDPKYCTMLHCPFAVGDEYEWYDDFSNAVGWRRGKIETQQEADSINSGNRITKYRHASHDLRDSPEYKSG